MARISSGIFNKWLATYGMAWKEGDPQGAANLYAEGAICQATPFDHPMTGKEAIQKYWQASFRRVDSNHSVEMDGILIADFDDSGTCNDFKEWWHRRETEQDDQ